MLGLWLLTTLFWWGFAFYPTEILSTEWLDAARNACFGTLENGLPDTYGWMILILGPLSFLIALFVVWKTELFSELQTLSAKPSGFAIVSISIVLIVIEGSWIAGKVVAGIRIETFDFRSGIITELPNDYPRTELPAPEFSLVDQNGDSIRLQKFQKENKLVLLSFAFAHCQSVCPSLVAQLKEAVASLDPDRVALLIVTLDPRRDTPSSLPNLADRWNIPKNGHLLSGSVHDVEKVIRSYNVPFTRDDRSGDIDHPALIYLIDRRGKIAFTFNNAPPKWIVEAFHRLEPTDGF